MSTFMLSALSRQYRGKELQSFVAAHPYCWLLWEPGAWTPPGKSSDTLLVRPATPLPGGPGESLALGLVSRRGRSQVTVGRGPENDLPINDATLSSVHLVLMQDQTGWTVRDAGSRNGSWLNNVALSPGFPQRLFEGASIRAAQVGFSFHTPEGLFNRIQRSAATPLPSIAR